MIIPTNDGTGPRSDSTGPRDGSVLAARQAGSRETANEVNQNTETAP
jgi:hypothetical protein